MFVLPVRQWQWLWDNARLPFRLLVAKSRAARYFKLLENTKYFFVIDIFNTQIFPPPKEKNLLKKMWCRKYAKIFRQEKHFPPLNNPALQENKKQKKCNKNCGAPSINKQLSAQAETVNPPTWLYRLQNFSRIKNKQKDNFLHGNFYFFDNTLAVLKTVSWDG